MPEEPEMDLISVVVVLIAIGVLLWAVQAYLPMDPTIRRVITAVVVIAVILWLLQGFGVLGGLHSVHVGR
jgi:ABC-type long-subunit fatty acid transport system fused permease/ATPase subunit